MATTVLVLVQLSNSPNILNHHTSCFAAVIAYICLHHNPQRGVTPLMKAADEGATDIALKLLNAGAKTDLQDEVKSLHCDLFTFPMYSYYFDTDIMRECYVTSMAERRSRKGP